MGGGGRERRRVELASREACKRGLLAWMCLASSVPRDSQFQTDAISLQPGKNAPQTPNALPNFPRSLFHAFPLKNTANLISCILDFPTRF